MLIMRENKMEKKTTEVLDKCESVLFNAFKASGVSVMDVISDPETGAMIGGYVDLYKTSKELAVMQSKVMDKMVMDFEELKAMNMHLRKQNEKLQKLLQDLNRKVEKIGN